MHPNIVGFVASAWIVLSLLSGKLFAYAMEKIISRRAVRKCSEGGQPAVTGAIVGARNAKQADGVMNAGTLRLTSREKAEIEAPNEVTA